MNGIKRWNIIAASESVPEELKHNEVIVETSETGNWVRWSDVEKLLESKKKTIYTIDIGNYKSNVNWNRLRRFFNPLFDIIEIQNIITKFLSNKPKTRGEWEKFCKEHNLSLSIEIPIDPPAEDMTIEYVNEHYSSYGTVKYLLDFIKRHNIPDTAKILYQRINDFYFETNGWKTVKKESEAHAWFNEHNRQVEAGVFENKEQYPNATEHIKSKWTMTPDEYREALDEFVVCWYPIKYKDDDNLYLTAHY